MFAEPIRRKSNRGRVSRVHSMQAPTKGWWVGDNLARAPAGTAFKLENWFPGPDYVRLRKGSRQFAGNLGGPVRTLMTFRSGTADKFFAATPTSIYDITGGGAFISSQAVVTGLQSGDWQYVNFTTTGGSFLICVNGRDAPRISDGAAWDTEPSIDDGTPSTFTNVWAYNDRLYFIKANSLSAWYLELDSIGGPATELPLGSTFGKGGRLVAGATWSVMTGSGIEELNVFITSEGEVAVFTGAYPGDVTSWSLRGVYNVGRPLGRSCVFKAGGDLAILCEDGIVPLSAAVNYDMAALYNTAITKGIAPEFQRTTKPKSQSYGWQMMSWPAEQMFIVNIPDASRQFISNLTTGAWCEYTGFPAVSWGLFSNKAFYGSDDGEVIEIEIGGADVGDETIEEVPEPGSRWGVAKWGVDSWGAVGIVSGGLGLSNIPYTGTIFWNYSDFKLPVAMKQVGMARVNAQTSVDLSRTAFTIRKEYDFTVPPAPTQSEPLSIGPRWGISIWGVDRWTAVPITVSNRWRGATGIGAALAPVYQVTVNTSADVDLKVTSVDMIFESGEVIG